MSDQEQQSNASEKVELTDAEIVQIEAATSDVNNASSWFKIMSVAGIVATGIILTLGEMSRRTIRDFDHKVRGTTSDLETIDVKEITGVIETGTKIVEEAVVDISEAVVDIDETTGVLEKAVGDLEAVNEDAETVADNLEAVANKLENAADKLDESASSLSEEIRELKIVIKEFVRKRKEKKPAVAQKPK